MRRRRDPQPEYYEFLHGSASQKRDEIGETDDLHRYVGPVDWPISGEKAIPSLGEGSATLNKNLSISLKEREWNSVDRHVKALGRSKSEWIRYALLKLMQEEQIYCFKKRKE